MNLVLRESEFPVWTCVTCMEVLEGCGVYGEALETTVIPKGDFSNNWSSDTNEGILEFSMNQCDTCRSHLGGARYRYIQWVKG